MVRPTNNDRSCFAAPPCNYNSLIAGGLVRYCGTRYPAYYYTCDAMNGTCGTRRATAGVCLFFSDIQSLLSNKLD